MSEPNHTETPAAGQAAEQPCADCASGGEKLLAGLTFLFVIFLGVMAYDMWSGGKVTGFVQSRRQAGE